MIEIKITQQMIDYASDQAQEMGEINNSIRHGKGNLVGFLGELVAQKVLGGMLDNTYDHDLLMDDFRTMPPITDYGNLIDNLLQSV